VDALPATLTLPSGGTVEFLDMDDLTGDELDKMRATVKEEDTAGQTTNALYREALALTIKSWDISYLPDPRIPSANPSALRKLKILDRLALENAITPLLLLVRRGFSGDPEPDDTPGSPTPPGSE
jgi:hypothetical protein